jgi:hypothetical protein
MSKLISLIGIIIVSITLVTAPADARGSFHGGGGFHGGHGGRFHGGGFNHGFRSGAFLGFPFFGGLPYPAYAAPYPVPSAAAPGAIWYYCRTTNAYYPYVASCAVPWQPVPSQ